MNRRPSRHLHKSGQALTEFLVIALVLIPLFLLIPLIAKYQDIAYQTQMASRYVAFDAIANNEWQSKWKDPAQLAGEVRRRFFSNPDAPIKTNDTAGNFTAHRNPFWNGPSDKSLIADFDTDIGVSFGSDRKAAQAGSQLPAADGKPFNGIGGTEIETNIADQLSLKTSGVFIGNVSVKLANLPDFLKATQPFDKIDLTMTRHTGVIVNGWDAANPQQVVSRIDSKSLVPGTLLRPLQPLSAVVVAVAEAGQLPAPRLGELEFWSDVVPSDRLK